MTWMLTELQLLLDMSHVFLEQCNILSPETNGPGPGFSGRLGQPDDLGYDWQPTHVHNSLQDYLSQNKAAGSVLRISNSSVHLPANSKPTTPRPAVISHSGYKEKVLKFPSHGSPIWLADSIVRTNVSCLFL